MGRLAIAGRVLLAFVLLAPLAHQVVYAPQRSAVLTMGALGLAVLLWVVYRLAVTRPRAASGATAPPLAPVAMAGVFGLLGVVGAAVMLSTDREQVPGPVDPSEGELAFTDDFDLVEQRMSAAGPADINPEALDHAAEA